MGPTQATPPEGARISSCMQVFSTPASIQLWLPRLEKTRRVWSQSTRVYEEVSGFCFLSRDSFGSLEHYDKVNTGVRCGVEQISATSGAAEEPFWLSFEPGGKSSANEHLAASPGSLLSRIPYTRLRPTDAQAQRGSLGQGRGDGHKPLRPPF